jgi:Tfp pilus assembly PilM family ATPase
MSERIVVALSVINVDQRIRLVRRAGLRTSVRWVIRLAVARKIRSERVSSFTARENQSPGHTSKCGNRVVVAV